MKGKKISIESIELSIRKSKMRENAGGNQNGGKNQGHEFVAEAESKASTSETGTRIDDIGRREEGGWGEGKKRNIVDKVYDQIVTYIEKQFKEGLANAKK